jgi:hypothetical protein
MLTILPGLQQNLNENSNTDQSLNLSWIQILMCRHPPPHGQASPPAPPRLPVSIKQLVAIKNDLLKRLVKNDGHHGAGRQPHHHQQEMDSSYSDFLVTHPPLFSESTDPLEADN